jgi:hypothetical protein
MANFHGTRKVGATGLEEVHLSTLLFTFGWLHTHLFRLTVETGGINQKREFVITHIPP